MKTAEEKEIQEEIERSPLIKIIEQMQQEINSLKKRVAYLESSRSYDPRPL